MTHQSSNKTILWQNIDNLAASLDLDQSVLYKIRKSKLSNVRVFSRERKGKKRPFVEPLNEYKSFLKKLDGQLKKFPLPSYIYGSKRGVSVKDMVAVHLGKPYHFKLDLSNFFPSTTHHRVYNALMQITPNSEVAELLTELTTFKYQLPLGFPTSNTIAEIILLPLARRLTGICKTHDFSITIYIDDIMISGSSSLLKKESLIRNIFSDMQFRLNESKTKMISDSEGAILTGVLLKNGRASVNQKWEHDVIRGINHYISNYSLMSFVEQRSGYLRLQGQLQWLKTFDLCKWNMYSKLLNKCKPAAHAA